MKLAAAALVLVFVAQTDALWGNHKANCIVSVWSDWSRDDNGYPIRTRTVVQKPRNGGVSCPKLIRYNGYDYIQVGFDNFMTGTKGHHKPGAKKSKPVFTLLPRDLLFMVDMSGSISSEDWNSTKHTLVRLIEKICGTVGNRTQDNRIAMITFSTEVVLNFDFKNHTTIESVRKAILNMPQANGQTCTGKAFDFAHQYLFDSNNGIRSGTASEKEVLVLTDGQSNCGTTLSSSIKKLKNFPTVFALAIGEYSEAGKAEIASMVTRPIIKHLFSLANFQKFKEMVDNVYNHFDKGTCAPLEFSKK